jgi:hypothetical protein
LCGTGKSDTVDAGANREQIVLEAAVVRGDVRLAKALVVEEGAGH